MKPIRHRHRIAMIVGALSMALGATPAFAEIAPHELLRPVDDEGLGPGYGRRDLQFHLDLGFYFADVEQTGFTESRLAISPLLKVAQPVGFDEVELDWGFMWFDQENDVSAATTFQIGNVFAAYYWVWRTLDQQIRLGVGAGAPTAILRDERPEQTITDNVALSIASGMRGWRDYWLWAPETASVVGHFDMYLRYSSGFVFGGQIVVGNLYGVDDTEDTEQRGLAGYNLLAQVDLDVAYDTRLVRSMLRASYVTLPLRDSKLDDDNDQINVQTEFRIRLGGADLVARLDVPIDEPFGFAFDSGKVWGVHIGVSSPTELRLPEPE